MSTPDTPPTDKIAIHSTPMTSSDERHTITLVGPLRYPGGKDGMYEAHCSCGYSTGPRVYPERAEESAYDHKRMSLAAGVGGTT